jgi:CubicO group peptidase (beta-lactamase class C family)
VLGLTLPAVAHAQNNPLRGLDAYIEKAISDWRVPGLGLAIVKGDSVIHSAGYGVREAGKPDRVDASTVFAIGSASKAFTAALMAMLVQEDRAKWDDKVTDHLGWFQVFDPYVTRELTLRDLLTHRSGLARGDRLWYATELEREEIVRRVRHLEPTWSLRSNFGYQNIMFLTAGEVEEELTGKTWDELVRERIFEPLGMQRSTTSVGPLGTMGNVATPHRIVEDAVVPIAWRNIDNIAPAGSINSSAQDMARWVRLQLRRGAFGGQQLIEANQVREMHEPQMLIANDTSMQRMIPSTHFRAYGMGWFLQDYRGRKLVHHGGNIDGMSALVAMMPEEDVGLVILTNMNGTGLPNALLHHIFDRFIGGEPGDWSARLLAYTKEREKQAEDRQQKLLDARVAETTPTLPLDRYAGTYEDEMYGTVTVRRDGDRLVVDAGSAFVGDLEHWHYDTFRAQWRDAGLGRSFLTFTLNARGEVARVDVEGLGQFDRKQEAGR